MILTNQKCLFAVKESVSGTFNAPSGTALVYAADISFNEIKPSVDRAILFNRKTAPKTLMGIQSCELGFKMEINRGLIETNENYVQVLIDLLSASDFKFTYYTSPNRWQGVFKEANDNTETVSFYYHEGDRRYSLKGCLGDVKISGSVGDIVYIEFSFKGVVHAIDTIAFPNPTYQEEYAPVILKNSYCSVQGVTLEPIVSFEFAINNDIKERKDFRATTGLLSYYNNSRKPNLTIDPEGSSQIGAAVDNLIDSRTGAEIVLNIGSSENPFSSGGDPGTFAIKGTSVPNQYTREDRDGILAYSLPMDLLEDVMIYIVIESI